MGISVNGTQYGSWDEVPPELRATLGRVLPDADGDGVPDLFSGAAPTGSGSHTFTRTTITVDGRTYGSMDEVPEDVRQTLRAAGLEPVPGGAPAPGAPSPQPVPPPQEPLSVPSVPSMPQPPPATAGPPGTPPLGTEPGRIVLDGRPVDASQDPPGVISRKRWWQRR